VVDADLARRTESHSTRNGPALAPRGIALIWKYRSRGRWRGGRPRIPLEIRQLIREVARANFLWGAPRIHSEPLKLGITVPPATVSRYMPTSRKGRRSQAWRTFIRNHAITIVQSHSFDSHNWAGDLLSLVRYRPRIFTYHLSAFVIAPVTGPSCLVVWLLVAVVHPRVQFTRIPTLTAKSTAVTHRCRPASRKVDLLTIDRIRGPAAAPQLKPHRDRSLVRSPGKRVPLRVQLSAIPRPRQIARIRKLQLAHWNATPDQVTDPIFAHFFEALSMRFMF
jgi:hypothetical protein